MTVRKLLMNNFLTSSNLGEGPDSEDNAKALCFLKAAKQGENSLAAEPQYLVGRIYFEVRRCLRTFHSTEKERNGIKDISHNNYFL